MRSHAKAVVAVSAVLLLTLALAANPASAEAPTVSIDPPSEVAYTTAKASGTVDPKDIGTWWSYETSIAGEDDGWSGFNYHGYAEANTGSQPTPYELSGLRPGTPYDLRLVANNSTDPEVISALESFTTLAVAKPTVTLDPVSGIGGEEASFQGEVNPNAPDSNENLNDVAKAAFETTYRFECSPACPNTPGNQTIAADDEPQTVSFDAEGLEPSTEYTVKLFASNLGGEQVAERSFTTGSLAPTAITHLAGDPKAGSVLLTGFVDPQNEETTYYFEWGGQADLSDARSLPASENAVAGSGGQQIPVGQSLSGLSPDTTYYFRLVTDSPIGPPSVGEIESFRTAVSLPAAGDGLGVLGDRELEVVNTLEKGENRTFAAAFSLDGERAIWRNSGPSLDSSYGGFQGDEIAERTSIGWRSRSAAPPRSQITWPNAQVVATTPDLSRLLVHGAPPPEIGRGSLPSQIFEYDPWGGELTPRPQFDTDAAGLQLYSADLEHALTVGVSDGAFRLVDVSSRGYGVAAVLPDGSVPNPSCGLPATRSFFIGDGAVPNQNWMSAAGDRFMFHSGAKPGGECGETELYLRQTSPDGEYGPGSGASTTWISGPPSAGPARGGHFIQANENGSVVFFVTATRLAAEDTNEGRDLYRFTLDGSRECLTCELSASGAELEDDLNPGVALSEDGSRAYFTSLRVLAPGAVPGRQDGGRWHTNLYVLDIDSGQVRYVGPSRGLNTGRSWDATVSPDGEELLFIAQEPGLDALTGSEGGGFFQYYRYDDTDRTLACISCPAGTAATGQSGTANPGRYPMPLRDSNMIAQEWARASSDAGAVVFETENALLPADQDTESDIYEWREGRLGLIGPGQFLGLTPDGSNAFFIGPGGLVAGTDRFTQLYVARVGGGFPQVPPPAPCGGEGCLGAPRAAPPELGTGTPTFTGPGNRRSNSACAKGKARKKGRCVKKQSKKRAKQKRANSNRGGAK